VFFSKQYRMARLMMTYYRLLFSRVIWKIADSHNSVMVQCGGFVC